ncbi:MAG: Ig-like domain-containing protein [Chloroflexota bacterium]|nr:Ig-like domain-containing protein [Chloroflexota bacterium]
MNTRSTFSSSWKARGAGLALALAVLGSSCGLMADSVSARRVSSELKVDSFSSPTGITIASNTQAGPSTITVSGLNAPIADVDVSLSSLTHPTTADLDILLVGPGGQKALIMSDIGDDAQNDSLTFSDEASERLPYAENLVSGTFQPTDDDYTPVPDTFAAPAPTTNAGSSLSVFNGTDGNGVWTLFIREQDNLPVETGSVAAWSLRIISSNRGPRTQPENFSVKGRQPLVVPAEGVLANDTDPDDDPLTARLAGQPKKGSVTMNADGSFSYRAKKKAKGTDTFAYLATDSTGLSAVEKVTIQITKGKKKRR